MTRPAVIGKLSASASGKYLYTVGAWLDAGVAKRQVLRSSDLGESWCVLPTPEALSEVAASRASETVLYALTCGRNGAPAQLLKTSDAGATWSAPVASLPEAITDCSVGETSHLLQTSLNDPDAVWLNGFHTSSYFFDAHALSLSVDGGESWTVPYPPALTTPPPDEQALGDGFIEGRVAGMLVDPASPRRVLAWGGIGDTATTYERPMRYFSSEDAGGTWQELGAPPFPNAGSRRFEQYTLDVLVDAGSTLYASDSSVLLRSADWGRTWTTAGTLPTPEMHLSALDASNAGHLFAWTRNYGGDPGLVWRSVDAGSSWHTVDVPAQPFVDPLLELNGEHVIVGLDSLGVSTTTNGGKTWTRGPIVPGPRLAQSPSDARLIWAFDSTIVTGRSERGASAAALRSSDGGVTWTRIADTSGPLVIDGANADVAYMATNAGRFERTEDGGQTWSAAPFGVLGGFQTLATCRSPSSCLYVLSSNWTGNDYACTLRRSNDRGQTFTPWPVPPELCWGVPTLAVAPDDPEHLVAACVSGVCESRDGGRSWTPRATGSAPESLVESVAFLSGSVVLAAISGPPAPFGDSSPSIVVRSTDGGASFSQVGAEGERLFASSAHPETAFVIGLRGNGASTVSRSDDSGVTWKVVSPESEAVGGPEFRVSDIVNAPDGGFIASTSYGLVQFR